MQGVPLSKPLWLATTTRAAVLSAATLLTLPASVTAQETDSHNSYGHHPPWVATLHAPGDLMAQGEEVLLWVGKQGSIDIAVTRISGPESEEPNAFFVEAAPPKVEVDAGSVVALDPLSHCAGLLACALRVEVYLEEYSDVATTQVGATTLFFFLDGSGIRLVDWSEYACAYPGARCGEDHEGIRFVDLPMQDVNNSIEVDL